MLCIQAAPQDSGFTGSRSSFLLKEQRLGVQGNFFHILLKGGPPPQPEEQEAGTRWGSEDSLSLGVCWACSPTAG